jgi:hypothetical protein
MGRVIQSRVTLNRATALLVALATSGCSSKSEPVRSCEAQLMPTLKAPSTYKLIDTTIGLPNKDGTQDVFLTYDAANAYNAPIRSTFWCVYNSKTGSAEQHDDSGIQADNMDALADNVDAPEPETASPSPTTAPKLEASATAEAPDEEVPVCDRPDSPEKFALMNEIGVNCIPD